MAEEDEEDFFPIGSPGREERREREAERFFAPDYVGWWDHTYDEAATERRLREWRQKQRQLQEISLLLDNVDMNQQNMQSIDAKITDLLRDNRELMSTRKRTREWEPFWDKYQENLAVISRLHDKKDALQKEIDNWMFTVTMLRRQIDNFRHVRTRDPITEQDVRQVRYFQ